MSRGRAAMVYAALLLAALFLPRANAIYLDSTIYEMASDESFISKRIVNDGSKQNLYGIAAVKIDRPGAGGERRERIANGELLFAPLSFSLSPGSGEFFKIFYRGPEDDRERYYRILFREMPMLLFPEKRGGKKSEAVPVVAMETILVVRPRKISFSYSLDESRGVIKNTGNTFFKLILHKGCHSADDEAEMIYLLPGETFDSARLKGQNKKFIVAMKKYIPLGNACFDAQNSIK
ncbi:molecular chaperone [uncultured Enterobacter sp.]|uniref:molecular chaperone n=1 Tax=uncultured Enterobacter sp. TaxID=238202 RepID=UPI00262F3843|nr:molecular chaperone [uncultured Enterobacter sp.]